MRDLQTDAQKALEKRDTGAFIGVAVKTVRRLADLPRAHPLHVPPHLAFVTDPSPLSPVFRDVVSKAFHKAYDVDFSKSDRYLDNNSGRAVAGPRGVGKSHGLKPCAHVVPQHSLSI